MSNSFDPMNYNTPGSPVHEISQARILECVTISISGNLLDELSFSLAPGGIGEDS